MINLTLLLSCLPVTPVEYLITPAATPVVTSADTSVVTLVVTSIVSRATLCSPQLVRRPLRDHVDGGANNFCLSSQWNNYRIKHV